MARWIKFEANKKIHDDFQNWLKNDRLPFIAVFGDIVLVHMHGTIGGLVNGWTPQELREYLVQQGFNESQPIVLASCYSGTFNKDAFSKFGFTVYDTMYPLYSFSTEDYFNILISEDDSDYELFCRTMCEVEILMRAEYKAALATLGSREKIEKKLNTILTALMEDKAIKSMFFKYRED